MICYPGHQVRSLQENVHLEKSQTTNVKIPDKSEIRNLVLEIYLEFGPEVINTSGCILGFVPLILAEILQTKD